VCAMRANAHNGERHCQDGRQHADSLTGGIDCMFCLVMNFKFGH